MSWCEGEDEGCELFESLRVLLDVVAIDQAFADEDVGDAVEQGDVGARLDGEVEVGHHGGFCNARVDDDELAGFGAGSAVDAMAEDGMVVGDIGADEEDHVCVFHIGVGAGWAVGAEGELVAGDGGGHAEGGVSVVVASAQAELDEFAERVELFCEELAGAYNAEGVVAVTLLDVQNAFDHGVEGFVPGDRNEHTVFAKERLSSASGSGEDVVFGEALGAEFAAVDGVVWIAADSDSLVVAYAEQHAAADGAVAACGLDPLFWNA